MPEVIITGWRYGLRKISMTHAIKAHAELRLSAAKAVTDRVLEGESVSVKLRSVEAASALARELQMLGAECSLQDGDSTG